MIDFSQNYIRPIYVFHNGKFVGKIHNDVEFVYFRSLVDDDKWTLSDNEFTLNIPKDANFTDTDELMDFFDKYDIYSKLLNKVKNIKHQIGLTDFKLSKKHKEFKPGQQVLISPNSLKPIWRLCLYSHWNQELETHVTITGNTYDDDKILPYKGNENLLGKEVQLYDE